MAAQMHPSFDESTDKWKPYLIKVEAYFEANGIAESSKKRALLVAALSTQTIQILAGRVAPRAPNALGYDEVVKALSEYYDPKRNEISESYKFNSRCQLEGESIRAFLVEIRRIGDNCNFGSCLDRMIRDRIVCGVRSSAVRKQLLAKKDLTLEEAEAIAIAAESAENNAQEISSEVTPLLKMQARHRPTPRDSAENAACRQCGRCGSLKHDANSCSWVKSRCYRCGQRGHLAKMCPNRRDKQLGPAAPAPHGQTLTVQETTSEDCYQNADIWTLLSARRRCLEQPIRRTFNWGGVELAMEVDTGSPVCVIARQVFDRHCKHWPNLKPSHLKLSCYAGRLPVLGELKLTGAHQGVSVECTLIVLDCTGPSLCGRDLLTLLDRAGVPVLQVGKREAPVAGEAINHINVLRSIYEDVFSEELGLMKGPPASLVLRDGAVSKFCKARPLPYALRDKVAKELDRLVSLGIISPIKHSDWATPTVPVLKNMAQSGFAGILRPP
ncbi:uncharacterized protein LOC144118977 [Amblyomma americanum]